MKIVAGMPLFFVSQSSRNHFWFLLEVSVLVYAQPLAVSSKFIILDTIALICFFLCVFFGRNCVLHSILILIFFVFFCIFIVFTFLWFDHMHFDKIEIGKHFSVP